MNKGFVSGGRQERDYWCSAPYCWWYDKSKQMDGGWCLHPGNRIKLPDGGAFASVSSTGGCDEHSELPEERETP